MALITFHASFVIFFTARVYHLSLDGAQDGLNHHLVLLAIYITELYHLPKAISVEVHLPEETPIFIVGAH